VLRKAATKLASGEAKAPIAIGTDELEEYLGRPKHFAEAAERTSVAGVATGLAVTGTGGDVLFIEANTMPGKGTLTLTGQLGDVMKESASIALSYVRSKGLLHGVDASGYGESDVHVHVPAGAIPKDGPSAGVTMTVALSSLLTGRPVKHNVGMTGEVTLQGRVLPVGGIKQKVLAAHRAGLTEVIIPGRNAPDLDDVPEKVRNEMTFHPVFTIDEALSFALEPAEVPAQATA
jgi:ATP-dependent Lon protease